MWFDAGFVPALDFAFQAERLETERIQRAVYLARYLRISPEETERTPSRLLDRYVAELSSLIEREGGGLGTKRENEYI